MEPQQPVPEQPYTEPVQPEQTPGVVVTSQQSAGGPAKNKLMLVVGSLAVLELLVIIILAASSGGNKTPAAPAKSDTSTSKQQGPQAATANSVQLTDDSISQDLSNLNDDKDLPANKLSDKALGL